MVGVRSKLGQAAILDRGNKTTERLADAAESDLLLNRHRGEFTLVGTTRHSVGGEAAAGGSLDFRCASGASVFLTLKDWQGHR
jgi:hypothetical protein